MKRERERESILAHYTNDDLILSTKETNKQAIKKRDPGQLLSFHKSLLCLGAQLTNSYYLAIIYVANVVFQEFVSSTKKDKHFQVIWFTE